MAWNVSIDNVTDIDTLWDWDALIQGGTIIFIPGTLTHTETITGAFVPKEANDQNDMLIFFPGTFAPKETIANAFAPQETIPGQFHRPETGSGSFST